MERSESETGVDVEVDCGKGALLCVAMAVRRLHPSKDEARERRKQLHQTRGIQSFKNAPDASNQLSLNYVPVILIDIVVLYIYRSLQAISLKKPGVMHGCKTPPSFKKVSTEAWKASV